MNELIEQLLAELLRDAHRYARGLEPARPTITATDGHGPRRALRSLRDRARDVAERTAARAGFTHMHYTPETAAGRLARILELGDGFASTYERLADERSRRALLDLLKLRVLGPFHAPLAISAERYREHQAYADRELRVAEGTFAVSDPWFSPLSLYRVAAGDGRPITLHSHSVDIVSVFLLGQYNHPRVGANSGDTVLDIGGCWGDTALYFASRVGPQGKVYTVEFDPENLEILRMNLSLNQELAARIEVVEQAVWDSTGESLAFTQAGRMTAVTGTAQAAEGRHAETIRLDDLVTDLGLTRLDYVKMDVEGAEPRVLRGASATLARFTPKLAIAAYHREDDLIELPAAINAAGGDYRLFLESFSALEDETVLFGEPSATSRSSST